MPADQPHLFRILDLNCEIIQGWAIISTDSYKKETYCPMAGQNIIAGRYQLLDEIGSGGMGTVYKGKDLQSQSLVAVKVLAADVVQSSPILLERFYRESETLGALNHPNIVKLLSTVEEDDNHFLIMEYVGGGSLKEYLLYNPTLPIKQILRIGLGVADALTRTHELGIIHRDVKPSNILLTEGGTPRLTDFGVAQTHESNLTKTGTLMGTVLYLSPEAFMRQPLDARADIWSFGISLFEMLTGNRPYQGDYLYEVMEAVLHHPLPDLEKLRADAPPSLIDLVYRMLTRNRAARIATMREVGAALEDVLRGLPATSPRLQLAAHITGLTSTEDEGLRFALPVPKVGEAHGFPSDLTPFVGRERDVRALNDLLVASGRVIVWGSAGVGKTRLVAQLHRGDDAMPRYYVDLRGLVHTDSILKQISHALGATVRPTRPHQPTAERLLAYLQHQSVLLVLDHADGWYEAEDWLNQLHTPVYDHVHVVVVRRHGPTDPLLGQLQLGPFEVREFRKRRVADEYPVTALYLTVMRESGAEADLRDDAMGAFSALLSATGGNPMATTLAAFACRHREMPKVADHIGRAYDYYTTQDATHDEGLRRVRAAFDAMSDLLDKSERDALLQLSIFAGKFPREAAQTVAEGVSLTNLRHLTEQGLIQRDPDGCFLIPPALAEVAAANLQTMIGLLEGAWRGYESYYADFARKFKHDLKGFRQRQAVLEFRAQFANLCRAWTSVLANDNDRALARLVSIWSLYLWLDDARDVGERLFWPAVEAIANPSAASNLNMVTKLLIRYGLFMVYRADRHDEANNLLVEGYNIAKQRNNLEEMAWAKYGLGMLAEDATEAVEHLTEAMRAGSDAPERLMQVRALIALSEVHARQGQIEKFDELNQEALHIAQEMRDKLSEIEALHSLARYADTDGEHKLAIQAERDLYDYYASIGDRWNMAQSQHHIALSHFKRGRLSQCMDAADEAIETAHAMRALHVVAAALALQAYASSAAEDAALAAAKLSSALAIPYPDHLAQVRVRLAQIHMAAMRGEMGAARDQLLAALPLVDPAEWAMESYLLLVLGAAVLEKVDQAGPSAQLLAFYSRQPAALRWIDRDPVVGKLRATLTAKLSNTEYGMMLANSETLTFSSAIDLLRSAL